METRGVVVKIKGNTCIVLTPGGEYRKVPLPKGGTARVGQEIQLERRKSFSRLRHFMVAASFLIFILAGLLYPGQAPPAAAYLTIDINPSIELAVSAGGKVISARGLNGDGERILREVKVKGQDLREAVRLIVARAVADRYLVESEDNVILATLTVEGDGEPVVDLESVYEAIKNPVESNGMDAEVIIEPVKPEIRQEAITSGISTGRYFLLQKSAQKGMPLSKAEISSMSLGKLEKEKKVTLVQLVDEGNPGNGIKEDNNGNSLKVERPENKVVKRGIYVERCNANANKNIEPEGKGNISGKKQNDNKGRKASNEHNAKKDKEERPAFLDRYNVDDSIGKNKTSSDGVREHNGYVGRERNNR